MGQTEFLKTLADSVSGPVRWQKVVHGLQVEGLIDGGTPAEIGKIIRHIREDVRDECLDDVKDQLWQHFERRFDAAVTKGFRVVQGAAGSERFLVTDSYGNLARMR